MSPLYLFIGCLLMGYILGSINFSIVVGKFYGIDIRTHGSGNAGMTNTLRTLGKAPAIIVTVGDMLKAVVAGIIGLYVFREFNDPSFLLGGVYKFEDNAGLLAGGFGALLGHNWPVFFRFKGGKGVLTTFALILMMDVKLGLLLFFIFVLLVLVFRYISLGSIVGSILFPIFAWGFRDYFGTDVLFTIFATLVALIVILKHKTNIGRLINGNENKFSLNSKKKDGEKAA